MTRRSVISPTIRLSWLRKSFLKRMMLPIGGWDEVRKGRAKIYIMVIPRVVIPKGMKATKGSGFASGDV